MHLNRVLLTLGVFGLLSLATAAQQAPPAPQPTTIDGAVTYVYKTVGGVELRLHIFSPATPAATPRPAAIFFFGGGWTRGTVTQFVPQARHLASRGMLAAVADYRVIDRHQTTPFDAMADAKSAIRWLRGHAGKLGVDPSRIAAAGGSSGGHLALSAAVFDAFDAPGEDTKVSSKPNLLILFNPAVDTSRESKPAMKTRFGGRGRAASPAHHLRPGLPPTLVFFMGRRTRPFLMMTSSVFAPSPVSSPTTVMSSGTTVLLTVSSTFGRETTGGSRKRCRKWARF